MDHEKSPVMGCRSLFEEPGIQHSNSGQQITCDMFINGYFMLLSHLTGAFLRVTTSTPKMALSGWS